MLRQAHHWAALLLPAAILAQLAVMFFTGAFRRPRQASWVLLFLILVAALAAGWSGYALPDDMLSGTGLRIVEGIVLGIPIVGTWIAALLFGGGFPGRIIETLYPVHLLVSVALVVLIAARVRAAWRHGVAQYPGTRRVPVLPVAAVRWGGLAASSSASCSSCRRRSRSARSGSTGRPTPATPRPAASPTGTPGSSTARCVSCLRAGRSRSAATP